MAGDPQGERWQGYLSDVRIYDRDLSEAEIQTVMQGVSPAAECAVNPSPADKKATDVPRDVVFNWGPGQYAKTHDVYFGTVFDDVNNASRTDDPRGLLVSQDQDANSYDPAGLLAFGQTCYWRVNEVNDADTPASWEGDVWSFTIPEPFVVDDFEKYNDRCNRIFFTWVDGQPNNGSADCGVAPSSGNGMGSMVGNASVPFAEQTIVLKGTQSLPLAYDNTAGRGYSEAVRTLDPSQDWTALARSPVI